MDEKEIRLNVRLPEELRNDFRKVCKDKALNSSELIRQWIEKFIKENK